MIAITDTVYETVMQALLDSGSPLAIRAIGQLRLAALESGIRDINDEVPALVSRQAG